LLNPFDHLCAFVYEFVYSLLFSGEVALPGGKTEEGDADDAATALRESKDEIGLDSALVTVAASLEHFLSKVCWLLFLLELPTEIFLTLGTLQLNALVKEYGTCIGLLFRLCKHICTDKLDFCLSLS
jgi:8-oxo-dGTP pyrophosphatase MutT (NUDIX family)